jgi:hypothetical protein
VLMQPGFQIHVGFGSASEQVVGPGQRHLVIIG